MGLRPYEWLERYFRFLVDRPDCYDVRPIHIFWEHKKLMVDRLRYLEARGILIGGTLKDDFPEMPILILSGSMKDYLEMV